MLMSHASIDFCVFSLVSPYSYAYVVSENQTLTTYFHTTILVGGNNKDKRIFDIIKVKKWTLLNC